MFGQAACVVPPPLRSHATFSWTYTPSLCTHSIPLHTAMASTASVHPRGGMDACVSCDQVLGADRLVCALGASCVESRCRVCSSFQDTNRLRDGLFVWVRCATCFVLLPENHTFCYEWVVGSPARVQCLACSASPWAPAWSARALRAHMRSFKKRLASASNTQDAMCAFDESMVVINAATARTPTPLGRVPPPLFPCPHSHGLA